MAWETIRFDENETKELIDALKIASGKVFDKLC
jgi:hypothetical protein